MAHIENAFPKIKKYVDETLNKNKDLFKTSNDEPTPLKCCEEMIGHIPVKLWDTKDLRILDPCAGFGNFMISIYQILKKKYSSQEILENIMTFNEINEQRLELIKEIFRANKYQLQITEMDFLKYPEDKKYDLQVVNPPYAKINESIDELGNTTYKRASKNHTLVRDFIEKSLRVCRDGGFIVYIVPNNWMSLADRNTTIKLLTQYQFHHLDIGTSKKYFPKIGSSFTYFILEKTPFYQPFTVKCLYKKNIYGSEVESQVRDFIPLCYNNIVQSITNKVLGGKKKLGVETTSDLHKYTKRHLIKDVKDETYQYKLIHTDKQTVYASRPHKYQEGYKVFLSTTGNWNVFIDTCGMTQSIAFIRVDTLEEAKEIKKFLEHPLYKFVNDICRWGNFNCVRILQRMSYPKNKNDIYESFGITQEEIKFIETI